MKLILLFHVLGAIITIGIMVVTTLRLPQTNQQFGARIKLLLGAGIFQIASGIALIATSSNLSLPSFCLKGLLYLASLSGFIVYLRHKQTQLAQ